MRLISALALTSLLSLPARGEVGGDSKYKGTAKDHTVTLTINAPGAVIMENELFVGHSTDRIDSAPGQHVYTISAPGYIPRLVYLLQDKGQLSLARSVTLTPLPSKGYELELDYQQAKNFAPTRKMETLTSLCADFTAAGLSYPENIAVPCRRQTIIDDMRVVGGEIIFPQAQIDSADVGLAPLLGRLDHAMDDDFYWAAEEQFAGKAGNPLAGNVVAYSAMRRQNCSRVMEIAMESSSAKTANIGLTVIRGLCLELAGKADKAAPIYQSLLKTMDHPTIDAYYQIGRATHGVNSELAVKALQTCIDKFPYAYLCYEGLAQVRALNHQQQAGVLALYGYHKAAAVSIRALFGPPPLHPDRNAVAAAALQRPYNFELAVAASALGVGSPQAVAQATLISDLPSLRSLLPLLDKGPPTEATLNVYQVIAKAYPKEPVYWVKLAGLYSKASRCDDAVTATNRALAAIKDDQRRAALIVTKASCLVRLGRYLEAKKDLATVLASGHDSWQAHYNLGIINERLGTLPDAVQEYNLALQGNVPDNVRAQIESRLNFEGGKKETKPAH